MRARTFAAVVVAAALAMAGCDGEAKGKGGGGGGAASDDASASVDSIGSGAEELPEGVTADTQKLAAPDTGTANAAGN